MLGEPDGAHRHSGASKARDAGRIRGKFLLALSVAIFGGVLALPRESFAQG